MSTKRTYKILWGYYQERTHEVGSWAKVVELLKAQKEGSGRQERFMGEATFGNLTVHGDGYDCDCDEGGFHVSSTGLTEEETEELEGLL